MNCKAHVTGGIVMGAALSATALVASEALNLSATPLLLGEIFAITLFFSLFPDLDVGSIPQRWFFRALFIILLVMAYQGLYEEATLLALVSMTPLLDHHRGWTHSFISALLFPIVLACLYEYLLTKDPFIHHWSFETIVRHLTENIWLVAACILGWYTHLFLDYFQKYQLQGKR